MEDPERPAWTPRVWKLAAFVLAVLFLVVLFINRANPAGPALISVIAAVAVLVTIWALVRNRRQRRRFERRLEAWAADRAVQRERLRIARELHDLTSHGLGLITVRAASTAKLTGLVGDTERRAALVEIERIGREATNELRRMLTLLRTPGDDFATLRPADTLEDLPAIVEAARRSGLVVETDMHGLGEIDPALQLTICATVREALANSHRHAGPTSVRITLERGPGGIRLDIRDDGPAAGWKPRPGAGYGLLGLRERVALHHGTVTAAHREGGFQLTAELPGGAH